MTRLNEMLGTLSAPIASPAGRGNSTIASLSVSAGSDAFGGLFSDNLLGMTSAPESAPLDPDFLDLREQPERPSFLEGLSVLGQTDLPEAAPENYITLRAVIAEAREQREVRRQQRHESAVNEGQIVSRPTLPVDQLIREMATAGQATPEETNADLHLIDHASDDVQNVDPVLFGGIGFPSTVNSNGRLEALATRDELLTATVTPATIVETERVSSPMASTQRNLGPQVASLPLDVTAARQTAGQVAAEETNANLRLIDHASDGVQNVDPVLFGGIGFPSTAITNGRLGALATRDELLTATVTPAITVETERVSPPMTLSQRNFGPQAASLSSTAASTSLTLDVTAARQLASEGSSLNVENKIEFDGDLNKGARQPIPVALAQRGDQIASTGARANEPSVLAKVVPQAPNQRGAEQTIQAIVPQQSIGVTQRIEVNSVQVSRLAPSGENGPVDTKQPAKRAIAPTSPLPSRFPSNRALETHAISTPSQEQPVQQTGALPIGGLEPVPQVGSDLAGEASTFSAAEKTTVADSISQNTPLEIETPEWEMSLVDRISANLKENGAQIELELTPETLGKLDVQMELTDGRAEITFVTETKEAARLISQSEGRLSDLLAQNGFSLGGQDTASREDTNHRNDETTRPLPKGEAKPKESTEGRTLTQGALNLIA